MDKLQAQLIIEILGRPVENVTEALQTVVTKMGAEKGIKILEKKYHEPVPVKDAENLFTAFADVLVELNSLADYFGIIFAYMPSHIELISPENVKLNLFDLNELGNALTQRLHNYDAIAKRMIFERDAIARKLAEVSPQSLQDFQRQIALPQQAQQKTNNPNTQKQKKPKKSSSKKSRKK